MSFSTTIARLVTQRRGLVWLSVALLALGSLFVLITRMKLDTEVLNLLPRGFESVEGLKVYNRDFSQVRALTFALVSKPDDADRLAVAALYLVQEIAQNRKVTLPVDKPGPAGGRRGPQRSAGFRDFK